MQKTVIKLLIVMGLITGIVLSLYTFRDRPELANIAGFIQRFGIWGPIVFITLYILATVFFLPGSILTIAGGFLFGPWLGTLYNITGAVIGGSIAFLISRYIASDWVAAKSKGWLKQCLDGVANSGWRFVAITRLVPLLPFNLLNYILGLTKISFKQYVIASAIFMLPGTFAYTYIGGLGKAAITSGLDQVITRLLIVFSLLILLALLPWFIKQWKAYRHEKS